MTFGRNHDLSEAASQPQKVRSWRALVWPLAALAAVMAAHPAKAAPGYWVGTQFGFASHLGTLVVGQKLMGPVAGVPGGLFFVSFNYITTTGRVTGGSYIFVAYQGTTPIGIQYGVIVPRIAGLFSVAGPPQNRHLLQLALQPTFGLGLFAFSTGPGTVVASHTPAFTIAQGQVNINLFQQTPFFFFFP